MSESEEHFEQGETLHYTTPAGDTRSSARWAAAAIAIIGLGLIFLGGCFLIGVLMLTQIQMASHGRVIFIGVLYVTTLGCVGGAVWLLAISIRRLIALSQRH